MRTIKFRAWLPDLEVMLYSNKPADHNLLEVWMFDANGIHVEIQEEIWKEGGGETIEEIRYVKPRQFVMQFIGTVDPKGVEIWEGDIIGAENNPYKHIVEYHVPSFKSVGNGGKDHFHIPSHWIVQGNIYENPSNK